MRLIHHQLIYLLPDEAQAAGMAIAGLQNPDRECPFVVCVFLSFFPEGSL